MAQDYKFVNRNLWAGANVMVGNELYVQNVLEFMDYLNETYLANGYKILSVDYLGEIPVNELEGTNSPRAMRYTYHLIKEINVK